MTSLFPSFFTEKGEDVTDVATADPGATDLRLVGKFRNGDLLAGLSPERVRLTQMNQAEFDYVCSTVDPTILVGYGLRVSDLSSLANLTRLQGLQLNWNTKATDLDVLAELPGLRSLRIIDHPNVRSIEPIQKLRQLEALELSGGVWNRLRIETLEPLRSLDSLRELVLTNIRVDDESLEPISGLRNLGRLTLSNQFPTREYARLSVALSWVDCEHLGPYIRFGSSIDGKDVLVVGKGKPFLDSGKDQDRIAQYTREFTRLQEEFRGGDCA